MSLLIIRTQRLILRPWRETDLELFAKLNADPKVMEFYNSVLTRNESDALAMKFQKEFKERGYGFWAIEVPGVADFIGYVGLNYWNLEMKFAPCIDIGWRLDSSFWGHGYATEGAEASLHYGFKMLGFSEIVAMATIGNTRSKHVMERLGMKTDPAENFEHPKVPKGDRLSWRVLYRLSDKEWDGQLKPVSQLNITRVVADAVPELTFIA
jgi:RimJ/RimL family protein N-acetyltransferase